MIASTASPLLLLLLLACPLMMVFMMRGMGHGHGHAHGGGDDAVPKHPPTLDDLRAQRDDLDSQIRALEDDESERLTPTG